jgi:hypothetical protein
MTPQERAAAVISRIGATTDTDSLVRMIAEEIRAAVAERDASAGPPPFSIAIEPPRRLDGTPAVRKPADVPSAFRLVRHPLFSYLGPEFLPTDPAQAFCDLCDATEPELGKTTLYFTDDGYHCESCMYDEYAHLRTKHVSLFAVQWQTYNEVRDSLERHMAEAGEGVDYDRVDYELAERLAELIARDIKKDEMLDSLSDVVSMLMRSIFYRTLHRHRDELPEGFELPGPDVTP